MDLDDIVRLHDTESVKVGEIRRAIEKSQRKANGRLNEALQIITRSMRAPASSWSEDEWNQRASRFVSPGSQSSGASDAS